MKKCLLLLLAFILICINTRLLAQGTAFTYQGQLQVNGSPANGNYDFTFGLYPTNNTSSNQVGVTLTNLDVGVTNGLFSATLDFSGVFMGEPLWLGISVRSNLTGSFVAVEPPQPVTPTPYAVYAETANAAGLTGTLSGNGSGLTRLSATALTGTVANSNLSASVALLNRSPQNFTGAVNSFGGNVGVGTTTPTTEKLVVTGGVDLTAGATTPTADSGLGLSFESYGGRIQSFQNQPLILNPIGNYVGIGTTNPANALEVNGWADFTGYVGIGTNNPSWPMTIQGFEYGITHTYGAVQLGSYIDPNDASGVPAQFGTISPHNFGLYVDNGEPVLTLNTNGNVGIGTDTPTTALQVNGTVTATTFSGSGSGLTNLSAVQLIGYSAATQPLSGTPILNMVWIVPGTFVMGAPTSDPDYVDDEPQHVVALTNGFWMGQHPVTQGEYLAVTGSNPSYYTGDLNRPVETVTWFNATNFCYVLTQNEQNAGRLPSGWVYRLPTESEWEYCCRAQTTSRYYFGNDTGDGSSLTNYAWYDNFVLKTQPVGQLLPNAWGLVDMVGNVLEWCQDWYVDVYPTANISYNPQGPASSALNSRVARGAGYEYPASTCRSAHRDYNTPSSSTSDMGFRVVLAPGH